MLVYSLASLACILRAHDFLAMIPAMGCFYYLYILIQNTDANVDFS